MSGLRRLRIVIAGGGVAALETAIALRTLAPELVDITLVAPTDRFRAAVQEAKIGPDKDIPHVSAPIIVKYATDLQVLGLL